MPTPLTTSITHRTSDTTTVNPKSGHSVGQRSISMRGVARVSVLPIVG